MGRDAAGVRGLKLKQGDHVVGAELYEDGKQLLIVTENGYGKRTNVDEFMRGDSGVPQSRGGSGMKGYQITEKTGKIAGCRVVSEDDDVMLIESSGVIIRMAARDINVYSRTTQGVIVMRIDEGNKVVSIERVEQEEEEPADTQETQE